ncbi:MAG: tetratricopeptide repeat protein, partial [Bacteroidetes bacterium]|nr:tetratricopeptide repeat protein [Bacteroidota bacterium]
MKTLFKILLAVLLLSVSINAQRGAKDGLKREALSHMNVGRYGEAIDLFNKYVSANAQEIDGYILRGLCFEKRGQYWDAITDFRKAKRLDNSSVEAITNLNRVIRIFHQILYKKIEGHEREIAINPSNPFNYLEIGKSYRYLEEWQTAEVWYDRYLVLDPNASADEIIRYAEVLTENKHISKGEKILQIWVDKYPSDWRLLSRLGWFRIWLGKHKQAEPVFVKALSIKPFFKEAQDGLDIVKKEGYMRPDVDGWREYPIDRYIRILALNPDDDETRFTLITELKKVNRVEEAYQNLLFLKNKYEGTDRYDQLYIEITSLRHDINSRKLADKLNELERGGADVQLIVSIAHTYGDLDRNDEGIDFVNHYIDAFSESRELVLVLARLHRQNKNYFAAVEILQEFVEKNPYDKEIILTIADSYASDYAFDDAIAILKKYLEIYPENQELDARYKLATYSAWNYDWEDARDQLNILLENDPQNINYKLLRSQIIVWTVETDNFDLADKYLNDILTKEPDHLLGLISMASLKIWQRDFDTAAEKIAIAKKAHGERDEINEVQKFYDGRIALEEEKKKLDILKQAGDRLEDGDCEGALEAYDEYLELETEPSNQIYIEYASLKLCIKKFDEALSIYERLLTEGPSVDVELARAKAYLWSGDFTSAQTEFVKLLESDPKNTELILLLADSYFGNLSYSKAVNLYESYLETTVDTSQNSFVRSRLNGMPPYGLFGGIAGIFNYFIPFGY